MSRIAAIVEIDRMDFIVAAKRFTTMLPVLLFVLAGSFLFTAGCKKSTSPPVAEPEPIVPQEKPPAAEDVLESQILRDARVRVSPYSESTNPEFVVFLEQTLDEKENVVAYQNLRIEKVSTKSEHIRIAVSSAMEDMIHGVFLKPKPMKYQAVDTEPGIPLYFQQPQSEDHVITQLKGSLSVISAEKTETYTIRNLEEFILDQSAYPDLATEVIVLASTHGEGTEPFALTFNSDHLVAHVELLDENQRPVGGFWPIAELLPDGRSRILMDRRGPLLDGVLLQFDLHSNLSSRRIDFDLKDLPIPEVDSFETERTKQYFAGESIPENIQREIRVQAHTARSALPLVFSIDETQPDHPVEIRVEVFSETTPDTIAVGNLKIDVLQTDTGSLVPVSNESMFFSKLRKGLQHYAPEDHYVLPALESAMVSFQFEPPASSIKRIEKFSGELTLVTAKSHEYLIIDNIMESLGEPLEHPALGELGVELTPVLFGDGINISLDPQHAFDVSEISAIDASGGTSTSIYSGRQQFGEKIVFSFHAQDKLPPVIPVRIRINHGLDEIRVPFEFKNLPIPEQNKVDEN